MLQELQSTFFRFIDVTQTKSKALRKETIQDPLVKSLNKVTLPWIVEEFESLLEFTRLVGETRSTFSGSHHKKSSEHSWCRAVHNYFCRSGYYLGLVSEESVERDELFSKYYASFAEPRVKTTYLAPLEFVHFAQPSMDFGTFQIKRFSAQELEAILQNHVNSIFYPWAAISQDSLKLLSQYWFIQVTVPAKPFQVGVLTLPASHVTKLLFLGYAEREYTTFPPAIESVLDQLCLFDWPGINKELGTSSIMGRKEAEHAIWWKFDVPIVLKMNDDLVNYPERMPVIPELTTEPLPNSEAREEPETVPLVKVQFDRTENQRFVTFVKHVGDIMRSVEKYGDSWSFMRIAIGYFVKAFFLPPNLEQLLWHIVVLEALLSEGSGSVTERLARRISLILGKDKAERRRISKSLRNLYDVRSSLVHGRPKSRADAIAIIDAYRFSRLAIIWFLNYLSSIQSEIAKWKTGEKVPSRQELLMLLDVSADRRSYLCQLMNTVPREFPYVAEWLGEEP